MPQGCVLSRQNGLGELLYAETRNPRYAPRFCRPTGSASQEMVRLIQAEITLNAAKARKSVAKPLFRVVGGDE
jgi:hypothetical protein